MLEAKKIEMPEAEKSEFRGKIYSSIIDTIGATPLVRVPNLEKQENLQAEVLLKLEFFNPLASVKDRIAKAMVEDLEAKGKITPGKTTLVEPTSGNTGIGLALVAASKGYRLILTMPESMSIERRKMLALLGAELVLTPKEEGVKGAMAKAEEITQNTPGAVIPGQFDNEANPEVHRRTTAEEIWKDCEGQIDIFMAGVGTGGTITGVGEVLKERLPDLKVIAIEPADSPVLSGGTHSPHKIQGIGAGFIPSILKTELIDEVMTVTNDEALETARRLAKSEGIPGGISSGAAVSAAIKQAKKPENKGKRIVVIIPSFAERYLSTDLFAGL